MFGRASVSRGPFSRTGLSFYHQPSSNPVLVPFLSRQTLCAETATATATPEFDITKIPWKKKPSLISKALDLAAAVAVAFAAVNGTYMGVLFVQDYFDDISPVILEREVEESFLRVKDVVGGPRADDLTHTVADDFFPKRTHHFFRMHMKWFDIGTRFGIFLWAFDKHLHFSYDVYGPDPHTYGKDEIVKLAEVTVDSFLKQDGRENLNYSISHVAHYKSGQFADVYSNGLTAITELCMAPPHLEYFRFGVNVTEAVIQKRNDWL